MAGLCCASPVMQTGMCMSMMVVMCMIMDTVTIMGIIMNRLQGRVAR